MRKDGQRFRERERDRKRRASAASEIEGARPAADAAKEHVAGRAPRGVVRRRRTEVQQAGLLEAEAHQVPAHSSLGTHSGALEP